MLLYVDGPTFLDKRRFLDVAADAFWEDRCEVMDHRSPDKYLHDVTSTVDSPDVHLMTGGWVHGLLVSEIVPGPTRGDVDHFMNEWLYGRLTIGHGGRFMLLPSPDDFNGYATETEIAFQYAQRWGYVIVRCHEDDDVDQLDHAAIPVRKAALVGIHRVPTFHYVGSLRPTLTFVGDTPPYMGVMPRPFLDRQSAEYFRPYGPLAINHFGYTTVSGFARLPQSLKRRAVAVGPKAHKYYPDLPVVNDVRESPTESRINQFTERVARAARHYQGG